MAEIIAAAYTEDPFPDEVLRMLHSGARHSRRTSLAECIRDGHRLRFRGRLFVPQHDPLRLRLLRTHHEAGAAPHPGRSKALELLKCAYFWPRMQRDVYRFGKNCHCASGPEPCAMPRSESCARYRSPINLGRTLRWLSLSACHGLRAVTPSG